MPQYLDNAPVVKYHAKIRHFLDFRNFQRINQDGLPALCKLKDQLINIRFCSHVNPLGGVVEQQDFSVRIQPPGNKYFLLVPAAQGQDGTVAALCLDIQKPPVGFKFLFFPALADQRFPCRQRMLRQVHVFQKAHVRKDGIFLAVRRQHGNPGFHGAVDGVGGKRLPMDQHFAAGRGCAAEHALHQLAAAGSLQAGQANHLPFFYSQAHIRKPWA